MVFSIFFSRLKLHIPRTVFISLGTSQAPRICNLPTQRNSLSLTKPLKLLNFQNPPETALSLPSSDSHTISEYSHTLSDSHVVCITRNTKPSHSGNPSRDLSSVERKKPSLKDTHSHDNPSLNVPNPLNLAA